MRKGWGIDKRAEYLCGMRIGLFFGSFNPVHTGHMIIANYFAENTDLQQVWFIVSPQNPFKEKSSLLDEKHRLYMVNLAVEGNYKLQASNIEFHLPQPSYTIDTLTYLKEKHPEHTYVLLMGSDNLSSLHKWKNYEQILESHAVYVYSRRGVEEVPSGLQGDIRIFQLPLLDISSTTIRQFIKEGKSVRYLVPEPVWGHLTDMRFYK
jgi:nicotinate-nucleotide adenylyltransferase